MVNFFAVIIVSIIGIIIIILVMIDAVCKKITTNQYIPQIAGMTLRYAT
jgi:hypothetical protein